MRTEDEGLRTEVPERPNIAPDRAARLREREAEDARAVDRMVARELEFLKVSTVLEELKALARRTAVPARWLVSVDGIEIAAEPENQMVCRRPKRSGGAYRWVEGVGDYLHRFDPVMVLALLEHIEELRCRVAGKVDLPEDENECDSCTVSASSCLYHQGFHAGMSRAADDVKRFVDNGFEVPLPPAPTKRTVHVQLHCTGCKFDALAAHVAGECCPACGLRYEWLPAARESNALLAEDGGA